LNQQFGGLDFLLNCVEPDPIISYSGDFSSERFHGMVRTCFFCEKQFTPDDGARPLKRLRNHYSLWDEDEDNRKKVICVCGPCDEQEADTEHFMPVTLQEHLLEWVHFAFIRGALTDFCGTGVSMDVAIASLRTRVDGVNLRILKGLEAVKVDDKLRNSKIYDPWFRDPCSNKMVVEMRLQFAMGNLAGVWFLSTCSVMRLNRNLAEQYPKLCAARSLKEAKEVIEACTDKNSITQLGNVSFKAHLEDLLILWQRSRSKQWTAVAEKCTDRLLKGDAFQTVLKEWQPPWRPRKTGCANLDMFRAYFVGKLLHRANSRCTYVEFPGGSLIRQPNSSSNVLLFDVLHGPLQEDSYSMKFRIRWWSSVTRRFRRCAQEKLEGIFPVVEDGEIEHSGCEFMRFNRRLYDAELHHLMHPGVKQIFDTLET